MPTLSTEQKIVKIRQLRADKFSDAEIARVLGVSREYVGQADGRRRENGLYVGPTKNVAAAILFYLASGYTKKEIREILGHRPYLVNKSLEMVHLTYETFSGARAERARQLVALEIAKLLSKGMELKCTSFIATNNNLYARSLRTFGGITQIRDYMSAWYATKVTSPN